ncbi:hypothetical protein P2Q00_39600 [Streptomyces coacervatus]|uniref:hypothetical protein n=1 Tax=Streptomyces coacervatus TaxID=647381 RepID=UPI0023D98D58|nr:hypothetical protein [Streptomyces coacervatus]MDF2271493.1 hypothetical protein [Streptomyces coacervatus]
MYASVLRHLALSAFVSSALVAAIAASALSSPATAPAADSPVVRLRPEPPVPSATTPCPALISSAKIRLQFDGKPFH